MNSNGNNGRRDGAVGVAERNAGDAPGTARLNEGPFAYMPFEDEVGGAESQDRPRRRDRRRRKRLAGASILLLVLVVAGAGLWMMSGGAGTKINVAVRDNSRGIDPSAARNNDDVTAQAIDEVRGAIATPPPATTVTVAPGATGATGTIVMPTTPVTVPLEGVGGVVSSATAEAATGQRGAASSVQVVTKPRGIVSERNPERSIRCAPIPAPVSARQTTLDASANTKQPERVEPSLLRRTETRVVLPPFGAMLPVRTLGALYTLRRSLVRFELLRDVRGEGWQMKKGTVLVGGQQGSEYDRAYVSLMGFIDPESKRFVKATGEVLGPDGAPGLQGRRRQVNSRWARVLGRVATGAVSLGQAALSRGGGTTIIMPGGVAPEISSSFNVTSRREFVEVPAATPAFVMITGLPGEAQGVNAEPGAESEENALTDEDLARLLESDSPEEIRAAIPRMSPELRRIAEAVLKEPGK